MIRKLLTAAIICSMLATMPSYALTKAVPEQMAVAKADVPSSSRIKLPSPSYCYISGGMLYWGRPEGVAGIYIEFLDPEELEAIREAELAEKTVASVADASTIVSADSEMSDSSKIAGAAGTVPYADEETAEPVQKKAAAKKVIKSADSVVDVSLYTKNCPAPLFRVRSVPFYSEIKTLAASDWVYGSDFPAESLQGLSLSGWVYVSGKWFFFKDGAKQYGRLTDSGKTYYLDPQSGALVTGWVYEERKWYYFSAETGELLKNTYTPDGCWVDKDGVWTGKTR